MILCMGTERKLAVGSWQSAVRTAVRVLLFLFFFFPLASLAQEFPPKPNSPVVDYTESTLSSDQVQSLNAKIIRFEDSTSIQFAVVIMQSIGGNDASEYAAKLGNAWGVGQEKKNNGIVMLISKEDHKIAIQIGKGLEGAATDGLTGSIIRREMQTPFRQGNFYIGIDNALTALMKITSGEFKADHYMKGSSQDHPPYFLVIIIIFIVIIVFFSRVMSVNRYARMNHLGFWAAWMLMNAAARKSRGSWGGFTGGGGFGGGGFGGGGGGGWGGFGGGSFGGGGASGSW